jgi:hypothetical protein
VVHLAFVLLRSTIEKREKTPLVGCVKVEIRRKNKPCFFSTFEVEKKGMDACRMRIWMRVLLIPSISWPIFKAG